MRGRTLLLLIAFYSVPDHPAVVTLFSLKVTRILTQVCGLMNATGVRSLSVLRSTFCDHPAHIVRLVLWVSRRCLRRTCVPRSASSGGGALRKSLGNASRDRRGGGSRADACVRLPSVRIESNGLSSTRIQVGCQEKQKNREEAACTHV